MDRIGVMIVKNTEFFTAEPKMDEGHVYENKLCSHAPIIYDIDTENKFKLKKYTKSDITCYIKKIIKRRKKNKSKKTHRK